jgi:hypothetical protein
MHMPPVRQHCLTPLGRRVRYALSRLAGTRLQKSQKIYLVDNGGARFKRIVLHDAHLAARIAHSLEGFGPSPWLPGLVACYEREVWIDYITGQTVTAANEEFVTRLAAFYGHLYARAPLALSGPGSVWVDRVDRDLHFLRKTDVIDQQLHADLVARLPALVPQQMWTGYDYLDPVLKNFVDGEDGQLYAIDVESLEPAQLLGLGVAKACARWMAPYRSAFFDALRRTTAPDIFPYFGFVELVFISSYTKLMYLEKKWKNVDVARFEHLREAG